jgi:protein-tyrosine phosphatase
VPKPPLDWAGLVDIHSHILPGVDDGAPDVDASLRMAEVAVRDGISTMVATPHLGGMSSGDSTVFAERLATLRLALAEAGISLDVRLGCEAAFLPNVGALAVAGALPTLADSRFVLLEWPQLLPPYTDTALFELRLKGYRAILAHVERYRFIQSDVNILVGLVERGALTQITASSLLGRFGPDAQRTAEALLERRLAHVIASDAHGADDRAPTLARAARRAAEIVGEEAARSLVVDVPGAIVENVAVEVEPPLPGRSRPFWAFWRHKY